MHKTIVLIITALLFLNPSKVLAQFKLKMQVGDVQVLAVPDVARVAVGDGHVINAATTSEKEVIIFAKNQGYSSVHVWSENGKRESYSIEVAPDGARKTQDELKAFLKRIPNTKVSSIGNKLLVEGDDLSDEDREKLNELSKRYPQLLDFTGQIGWDRMVLLDVQVVELPKNYLQELGIRWGAASVGGLNTGIAWDGGSTRLLDRPGQTVLPIDTPSRPAAGYFGVNAMFSATINALAQNGDAVVLAQPQLLARSGAQAEFLAGGEVPYSTVDTNGNVNTEFKPYGVSLKIIPQIQRNDAIRSKIEVEVSSVDTAYSAANGPALKTRRAATEFNVKSGQTLVLAGFVSRENAENIDKVPTLGDIPILGNLFKSKRFQDNETELAIFVTPVVVTAEHPDLLERVNRGKSIIDQQFNRTPRLNVAINHHHAPSDSSEAINPVVTTEFTNTTSSNALIKTENIWNPFNGAASQWSQEEIK